MNEVDRCIRNALFPGFYQTQIARSLSKVKPYLLVDNREPCLFREIPRLELFWGNLPVVFHNHTSVEEIHVCVRRARNLDFDQSEAVLHQVVVVKARFFAEEMDIFLLLSHNMSKIERHPVGKCDLKVPYV